MFVLVQSETKGLLCVAIHVFSSTCQNDRPCANSVLMSNEKITEVILQQIENAKNMVINPTNVNENSQT